MKKLVLLVTAGCLLSASVAYAGQCITEGGDGDLQTVPNVKASISKIIIMLKLSLILEIQDRRPRSYWMRPHTPVRMIRL